MSFATTTPLSDLRKMPATTSDDGFVTSQRSLLRIFGGRSLSDVAEMLEEYAEPTTCKLKMTVTES
jgi:hypothetical protein